MLLAFCWRKCTKLIQIYYVWNFEMVVMFLKYTGKLFKSGNAM